MQDLAPSVLDDKETVKQLECHGEEVEGHQCLAVVFQKGKPPLTGVTAATTHSLQIAGHAPFGNDEAQLRQFPVDSRGSPVRVLLRQPPDQAPDFRGDLGPAAAGTRAPAPIPAETRTMPSHDGRRLHQNQHVGPVGPKAM